MNEAYFAVGIPCFTMNCFAKSLLPSNWAAMEFGPITEMPVSALSFSKNSTIPFTKGSSGPTMTILMLCSITAFFMDLKSVGSMGRLVPNASVPALPGAIYILCISELCEIFHAKACSLPPEPNINTFML